MAFYNGESERKSTYAGLHGSKLTKFWLALRMISGEEVDVKLFYAN
jgi:hypothetical protein